MRFLCCALLAAACSVFLLASTPAFAGGETVISGRVWEDEDRNGVDDDGTSIEGVLIQLRTLGGSVIGFDTTDAFGDYQISSLEVGPHELRVFPPTGFLLTHPLVGAAFEDSDFDRASALVEVDLMGAPITDIDAGVDEEDELVIPQGTVHFGDVASTGDGGGVTLPVELANVGGQAAEVESLGLINTSTWNWAPGTCPATPFVLAANASCHLELTATPPGTTSSSLSVSAKSTWNLNTTSIGSAQAQGVVVRFVDALATSADDGSSWQNAHSSLIDALAVVDINERLWMRSGIYRATAGPFSATTRIRLAGGFAGTESGLIERDLDAAAPSVLSGDIAGDDIDPDGDGVIVSVMDLRGTNAERVISQTEGLELDGIVISAADGALEGAAISATGSLTLNNVRIVANRGASAVWKSGTGGKITDSVFENNDATALFFDAAYNAAITSSRFVGNQSSSLGGAIRALNATSPDTFSLRLRSVLAVGNRAAMGGAIYFEAQDIAAFGGGCLKAGENNDNEFGGGGCNDVSGRLVVSRSTFAGNSASGDGGALWLDLADLPNPLSENIFWRNADHSGTNTPSAAVHYDDTFVALFDNSNVAGSGGSGSWNVAFGTDGGGNLDLNPLFVDDVSPSRSPTDDGDYRLWASSPLIDLGSTSPDESTDAAGNDRVDGLAADLGALEGAVAGIYGRVWRDINGDGIQDASEPGRANVTVNITAPNTMQTTTDADGTFRFADLADASYNVSLTLPDGFDPSPLGQGNDTVDSDIDQLGISVPVAGDSTDVDGGLIFNGLFMDDFESGNAGAWTSQAP